MCKGKTGKTKIVEVFQDNIDKEVRDAGPIFCEPLNGKLVDFPATLEEYEEMNAFQISNLRKASLNELAMTVNARSFAIVLEKPFVSEFKEKYAILDMQSSNVLEPMEEVLDYISEKQGSYQTKEELCYIMTTTLDENMTETANSSIFTNEMCGRFGGWWTVCQFDRPIFISLAGLCSGTPMDKIFSLVEPKQDQPDRYGTFVGVTG